MQRLALGASAAAISCLLMCGCEKREGNTSAAPASVPAAATAALPDYQKAPDAQAVAIRAELLQKMTERNCNVVDGLIQTCQKLTIPCAYEYPVSPADEANGIGRKLRYVTHFIRRTSDTDKWEDVGQFILLQVPADNTPWKSTGTGWGAEPCDSMGTAGQEPGIKLMVF